MEIKNLRDLKNALKDVPDEVLENFGAGVHEEPFVELMAWAGDDDAEVIWEKNKKYSTIDDINSWIKNMSKLSQKIKSEEHYEGVGFEEPISSEDKI